MGKLGVDLVRCYLGQKLGRDDLVRYYLGHYCEALACSRACCFNTTTRCISWIKGRRFCPTLIVPYLEQC